MGNLRFQYRDREMRVVMYPPIEFFDRTQSLEDVCKKARDKDKALRTQIRIGELDIELHTQRVETHEDRTERHGWKRRNIDMFREFGELKEPVLKMFIIPVDVKDMDMKDELENL